MKEKLTTVVKFLAANESISKADLEKYQQIYANQLILVKVGDDNYSPSVEELEEWKSIFERASKDPDFKIFTHSKVSIEVIDLGNIISVE